jgi:glycosyltransferase involved in cell wall biosynthesis
MQSKVSMVVPCYNKAAYIGGMLDSVMAQEWDNIELILVNDGSTDGTREIIAEYEPRLRGRGYELNIIDQENQGVAAAVRNGLMRVSGEYVCIPDCDDKLHPEYVSVMAVWLEEHPEDEWIECDCDTFPYRIDDGAGLKRAYETYSEPCNYCAESLLECHICHRVNVSVCARVVRADFMRHAIDFAKFDTHMRDCQEPQINYRLAARAAGRCVAYVPRTLYFYNTGDLRQATMQGHRESSFQACRRHYELKAALALDTLRNDGACQQTIKLAEVCWIYIELSRIRKFPESAAYVKAYTVEFVDKILESDLIAASALEGRAITLENIDVFFRAFSNVVIGYEQEVPEIRRRSGGRLIGYAALSRAAKGLLPCVAETHLRPDILWDVTAKSGAERCGIAVTPPDFDSLTADDTVLVFLKDARIAGGVCKSLESTKAAGNIYYYYDVLDYMASQLFPGVTRDSVNYGREAKERAM